MIGSGTECEIQLQADDVQALEATLEIGKGSQVRLIVPGQETVETELPLNIAIGEGELTFFRSEHTHGWCEPVTENDENQKIGVAVGGLPPLPRTLQAKTPLLLGSLDSCDILVPEDQCPGVAVAIWLRGANRVLLQVLDNSAPVDWPNRGDVLEGEAELPLTVSVSGTPVNITTTPKQNASLTPIAVRPTQPPTAQGGADGELVRKKPSGLLVIGAGLAAMLLTALIIHFLFSPPNPQDKVTEPTTSQDVVASSDVTMPNGAARVSPELITSQMPTAPTASSPVPETVLAAEANAALQPTSPVPEQSKASSPATPTVPTAQPETVADAVQGPTTVAVLEFENSSKKEEMEPLRKGLRDMMMTDLSQVSSIKMVERGRLQDLLQEMQLAEGQFIDPATAAKLGKGLAATAVLTGSYLALGENIRIDARMVKVETGEVMMAEQVAGTQDDFFTLQKILAEKMVDRLDVAATPQEQLAMRRPQTANFKAFTAYSRGVDSFEAGQLDNAKLELESAVRLDPTFQMANRELNKVRQQAVKSIGEISRMRAKETSPIVTEVRSHVEAILTRLEAKAYAVIAKGHYDEDHFLALSALAEIAERRGADFNVHLIQAQTDLFSHINPLEEGRIVTSVKKALDSSRDNRGAYKNRLAEWSAVVDIESLIWDGTGERKKYLSGNVLPSTKGPLSKHVINTEGRQLIESAGYKHWKLTAPEFFVRSGGWHFPGFGFSSDPRFIIERYAKHASMLIDAPSSDYLRNQLCEAILETVYGNRRLSSWRGLNGLKLSPSAVDSSYLPKVDHQRFLSKAVPENTERALFISEVIKMLEQDRVIFSNLLKSQSVGREDIKFGIDEISPLVKADLDFLIQCGHLNIIKLTN